VVDEAEDRRVLLHPTDVEYANAVVAPIVTPIHRNNKESGIHNGVGRKRLAIGAILAIGVVAALATGLTLGLKNPTPSPTVQPTPSPTVQPTPLPMVQPTPLPTVQPTPLPTVQPTPLPTVQPTPLPTIQPTPLPTIQPTPLPTVQPNPLTTVQPNPLTTVQPNPLPTVQPNVPTSASIPPTTPPPIPPDLMSLISENSFDGGADASNTSTPQNEALNWLAGNTNLDTYSDKTKIQRYALATLYHSTGGGETWDQTKSWLTDADECSDWNRLWTFCSEKNVTVLRLPNGLQGTIPDEIALLSDLGK
jgi:outer membrane biosynthesis protein TonB